MVRTRQRLDASHGAPALSGSLWHRQESRRRASWWLNLGAVPAPCPVGTVTHQSLKRPRSYALCRRYRVRRENGRVNARQKARCFCAWLERQFGAEMLRSGSGVVEVCTNIAGCVQVRRLHAHLCRLQAVTVSLRSRWPDASALGYATQRRPVPAARAPTVLLTLPELCVQDSRTSLHTHARERARTPRCTRTHTCSPRCKQMQRPASAGLCPAPE